MRKLEQVSAPVLALLLGVSSEAQTVPALSWISNSSVKLEQIIGDRDWAALARGTNLPTTSQTITRFNIEGTDLGCSFQSGTNLLFFFGDTIGINAHYMAADSFAATTTQDGESGLLLNFFTNSAGANVFVTPPGISMAGNETPNAGICLSNVNYIICSTGYDGTSTNPFANVRSVLVTFYQTNLTFQTNRTISTVSNGGHFILDALHLFGTNVLVFGEGNYRASDIYLAMTPAASFLSGAGTIYFTGLTNGEPTWSTIETNAVPVVQDNPTNGPVWPHDFPSVGNISVVFSTDLSLWLMTYDGGRASPATTGIYFSCAPKPWGPWSQPQLIFNATRDHGFGDFVHNATYTPPGPIGPMIDPQANNPTNANGGVYAPYLIGPFTRVTNNTLYLYYTMSTWNPYTVVKMRSGFVITPVIDPGSLSYEASKGFAFSWAGATSQVYLVDYSPVLPVTNWLSFTNALSSSNGVFRFLDRGLRSGGLESNKYYRIRSTP